MQDANPALKIELWTAVLAAQAALEPVKKDHTAEVRKDGRVLYEYKFVSTEQVIMASREALIASGVVAQRVAFEIIKGRSGDETLSTFRLLHAASGESESFNVTMPISSHNAADKALAGALTYAWAYWLRDVLAIPREDENTPDKRTNDDGPSRFNRPEDDYRPAPEDKHWSAFQGVVNRLSAALKVPFDQAYSKVREHANIHPKGEPTDAHLATLTAAAGRLLAEAQAPADLTPALKLKAAVDKVGKLMAMERKAACKLVESKAGLEIEGAPTPAQVVALLGAAERLLAEGPPADRDRQHTPERDEWVATCRELINLMKADYTTAEGEAPDEDATKGMRDFVTKTSGIDHRRASEDEFKASTALIKVELDHRRAP